MPEPDRSSMRSAFPSLAAIAIVIAAAAAGFGYTAGWFSPQRLTPEKMVDAFVSPTADQPGHRRNHAKGICFTGMFESNGAGSALSQAQVFARGQYPALGRFNVATPDPKEPDAKAHVVRLEAYLRQHYAAQPLMNQLYVLRAGDRKSVV